MPHELTYGLVADNKVVLYPLTLADINQRNDPTESYYICYYDPNRPQETLTHKVVPSPVLVGTAIFVSEKIVTRNITELFEELYAIATSYDENNQPYLDRAKIEPEMYTAFMEIVRIEVQAEMDAFAQTRNYDDMKSLCNYATSIDPTFQAEAQRGIYLRDTIWRELFTYFEGIVEGTMPIPTNWDEIRSHYPALTWE